MKHKKLSREEIAKIEIGKTTVCKTQILLLSGAFLALIFIYPICQITYELKTREIKSIWQLQPLTIFPLLAEAWQNTTSIFQLNKNLSQSIKSYEDTLEDTSALRAEVLEPAQKVLLNYFRTGNEKVILGKDNYLFYSETFNYVVNPGFMQPEQLKKRAAKGVQPNPVLAISHFAQALNERNIRLIVLPIPVEAVVVEVVDISEDLKNLRDSGIEPFLKTDTHWTPAGMKVASQKIAKLLSPEDDLASSEPNITYAIAHGDLANMLNLSDPRQVFRTEKSLLEQFDIQSNRDSRILLLGDSFTNIFSLEALNWGVRAGFAEHLMANLGEPIDVIARNDSGAYSTRQLLANELKKGRDRLAGKEVVIWEFVAHQLTSGDWKIIDMTLGEPPEELFFAPSEAQEVTATVLAISEVPRPNSAPYSDHIMSVHIGDINGGNEQAVVYMVSMENNVWSKAAQLRSGEEIKLKLFPWVDYENEFGSWNRSEVDDPNLMLQDPCWGEL